MFGQLEENPMYECVLIEFCLGSQMAKETGATIGATPMLEKKSQ
jgi:hypothetical protein